MSDDIEDLKKERMEKLQEKKESQREMQKQQEEQKRQQLKQIASKILTAEAQSRLGNVRTAKPDLASTIEMQLVQLYKSGRVRDKITDEQLKELLKKVQESKREPDIKY